MLLQSIVQDRNQLLEFIPFMTRPKITSHSSVIQKFSIITHNQLNLV